MAPSCAGQNSPWAIISPCASKTAHERSFDSLKMGEYAVRIIAVPISRVTFTSRWSMTDMVMASTGALSLPGPMLPPIVAAELSGAVIRQMPSAVTDSRWSGSRKMVESGSSMTAGPLMVQPARRSERR